jgi:hypothetical protein
VATIDVAFPSGLVLGGGNGGRAGESTIISVVSGLDRVFTLFYGVLVVNLKDCALIFLFFLVLLIFVTPSPI